MCSARATDGASIKSNTYLQRRLFISRCIDRFYTFLSSTFAGAVRRSTPSPRRARRRGCVRLLPSKTMILISKTSIRMGAPISCSNRCSPLAITSPRRMRIMRSEVGDFQKSTRPPRRTGRGGAPKPPPIFSIAHRPSARSARTSCVRSPEASKPNRCWSVSIRSARRSTRRKKWNSRGRASRLAASAPVISNESLAKTHRRST